MALAEAGIVRSEIEEYAREARIARLVALVLDIIVVGILTLVVNGVFGVAQITSGSPIPQNGMAFFTFVIQVPWPVITLLTLVYFTVPEAMFGATPGKHWARLRVVRVDGRPLTVGAVVSRNMMRLIDGLPFFYLVGGLSVLVTRNSQRLGDLAAGTTVVYRHRALEPRATRTSSPAARRRLAAVLMVAVLFTIAFEYFGRPALEIEGMFNTGRLTTPTATSYTLGQPQWGLGSVTYPVTTRGATGQADCTGSVTMQWNVLGWAEHTSEYVCAS